MKTCIVVGRHKFLPDQERDVKEKLGCGELVYVKQVNDINKDILGLAKEKGAAAIVVQALPLPLMAQLLSQRGRPPVYFLKMEARGLVESKEEAEEWQRAKPGSRIYLPPPPTGGGYRLMEYVGPFLEKRVVIEEEPVDP